MNPNDLHSTPTHVDKHVLVEPWKILIVDDDMDVHHVTKLALKRFHFLGRPLQLISAYSAAESLTYLQNEKEIAVAFIDVVMEEEDSGLKLVHYIRKELQNSLIRIILRTGQPGMAPEKSVVTDYDINDYKEKTELTSQKLYTTLVTALRSFDDLNIIERNRIGLEKIITSSADMFKYQSMTLFANGILDQIVALLRINPNALYGQTSSFAAVSACTPMNDEASIENERTGDFSNSTVICADVKIMAATGSYLPLVGNNLDSLVGKADDVIALIKASCKKRKSIFLEDSFLIYFESSLSSRNVIYFTGVKNLNDWDLRLLEVFSKHIAIAFDNNVLRHESDETQKEIIFNLGELLEVRSNETSYHVRRVSEISKILGRHLDLKEDDIETLGLAAAIHDIGKVAIPDTVLNKPDRLTQDEFDIIKGHAQIGYNILNRFNRRILKMSALGALQHHERVDGTGYPNHLHDDEIHIFGRIIALADVFDAITNDRVYKKAWTLDEAMTYIISEKGKQFDANIVDIFVEYFDEIQEVLRVYANRPVE